jgi:hypothetical protein
MCRDLQSQGKLETSLDQAASDAADQMSQLEESGVQPHEASEVVMPTLIYLPPESDVPELADDSEQQSQMNLR